MIIPKSKTAKGRRSSTSSIPAPTGGLNGRDAIADMPETDAVTMENFFPGPNSVSIRNGYEEHATGLPGTIETLMTYNSGAIKEIFAVSGGEVYDVTASGAVGAAVFSGLANSRWQYVTIGTAGGYFLLACNGVDDMLLYDGASWNAINSVTTPSITGVNTSDIISINNFKNRVWLIEDQSLTAWYLPVSSIGGAASALDLSALFKLGGYLMCMHNWTIDNANGIDDYAAFITSEGEVALYRGTDPSSSNTWALVGTFRMGRPIGRRCAIKIAADVVILTTDGAFPLSKALLTDRSQSAAAVTDKITNIFKPDIRDYSSNFGWQPILYPFGNKLIINIPSIEGVASHQYVMNTVNASWCKFTGWNAICWETLDNDLYFGGDGTVYKADVGESDNGANIETDVQQAFSYFNSKGQIKKFNMARPIFIASGSIAPALHLNVDYETEIPISSPSFTEVSASLWDVSPWDTSDWGAGNNVIKRYQSVSGVGYSGGIRLKTATKNIAVAWVSTDFVYEKGGII